MNIKDIKPSRKSKWKQNYYKPINESKYIGSFPIICRSSWETKFCIYCDNTDNVLEWASEPVKIEYYNPVDKKYHFYYPDFYIKIKTASGKKVSYLVEIKPESLIKKPIPPKRKTKKSIANYKYAVNTYIKNFYKILAVKKYVKERGWEFIIITEKFLK